MTWTTKVFIKRFLRIKLFPIKFSSVIPAKWPALIVEWPIWLNGWVFVYELSGCAFESSCSHLKFRFRACFKLGAPWHSSNYSVWIHSERRIWHDKNIQTVLKLRFKFLFHVTWALISLTLVQNLISSQGTAVADNYFTWCPSLFPSSSKKNSHSQIHEMFR